MARQRFKNLGLSPFFGGFVYERIVPRDRFPVKLNQVSYWEAFVPILLPTYVGLAEGGRPPYSPLIIFKMIVITHLCNLSERQTKEVVSFQLPVKEFVGLSVDEPAPDHSTLCRTELVHICLSHRKVQMFRVELGLDFLCCCAGIWQTKARPGTPKRMFHLTEPREWHRNSECGIIIM